MAWVKLDDHFDQHPKLQSVGPLGLAMWVAGIAYCNRNLTDGLIPYGAVASLVPWRHLDPEAGADGRRQLWQPSLTCGHAGFDTQEACDEVVRMLLAANLWHETSTGYTVHDYLGFQPSKSQVLTARDKDRKRKSLPDSNGIPHGFQTDSRAPDPVPVAESKPTHLSADADARSLNGADRSNGHGSPRPRPEKEPPGFSEAYAEFPRKVGRRAAAKAYAAARRRHPDLDDEDIANAVRWYAERIAKEATEERFIPHPATWINQDRFLEEFNENEA